MVRTTSIGFLAALVLLAAAASTTRAAEVTAKPNVIIILTDDQGFGELGATGNPLIRTPHIDRLAAQGVSLVNFHVMPVCSPTRACLMTGRYNYRTGVTDTYLGRSLMHPDETTLAEMLAAGGYRTGIFGKWHLGDNYPMRAMDKGFQESLVLNGGGLAQPGDPPDPVDERGAYFNATLRHNGAWVKTKGYVSDVITDGGHAVHREEERSAVLRLSALQLPARAAPGAGRISPALPGERLPPGRRSRRSGHPMAAKHDPDDLARVYGMIENIDDNVGRLLAKLDELKLADNTIVVLFSDNGCQQHNGYNAGFKGWKGTPFEGGIHQFCFIRWPGQFQAGRRVDRIAAHIDLAPTLLDLCGVPKPAAVKFDGREPGAAVARPAGRLARPRALFPVAPRRHARALSRLRRAVAGLEARSAAGRRRSSGTARPPSSSTTWRTTRWNCTMWPPQHPDRVAKLKAQYDAWFNDVTAGRDYTVPARIFLGASQENPVLLTRQDWRGTHATMGPKGIGHWEVNVVARRATKSSCGSTRRKRTRKRRSPAAVFRRGSRQAR